MTAPNLLIITTDDQRYDEMIFMPKSRKLLARAGTQFTQCRTNVALCSPARTGILSGQYSKYHNVKSNLNNPSTTIYNGSVFVALHNAGYRVGAIGKFLSALSGLAVKPGFDYWRAIVGDGGTGYGIYEPDLYTIFDGTSTFAPGVYQETYMRGQATTFVAGTQPWCLWYCPTNPHWPFIDPSTHTTEWVGRDFRLTLETDVSDKPSWIQALPAPTPDDVVQMQLEERSRLHELLAVDDTVVSLMAAIPSNTIVIFTSDNGNMLGEHRVMGNAYGALAGSKNVLYEAAMHVPLMAVGTGFTAGAVVTSPTTHQDITATMLDVASTTAILPNQPGISLKAIAASPTTYTSRQLLHYRDNADGDVTFPNADGITVDGVRKLIRHQGQTGTDQYEMYDLDTDPNEFTNVAYQATRLTERNTLEVQLNALLA